MYAQRSRGITLIELMVVVVIVAILAAIAYPSYRNQVIRSGRTEAKTALLQRTQALEKCYTRVGSYTGCAQAVDGLTPGERYLVTVNIDEDGQGFGITATPQGGQADDARCGTLIIDERGQQDKTGPGTVQECW